MGSEVPPLLAPWHGSGSAIAQHATKISQQCIEAYRANPLLIREHANIERGTAEGGYGRRQLYELVQNGADQLLGSSGRVEVILSSDALYCANEGSSVDLSGVEALLCSHLSSKRGWEIGRFGLGFKSVLGISDCPEFYSRSGSFVFNKKTSRERISSVAPSDRYPILRLAFPVNPAESARTDSVLEELMSWASTVVRLPLLPETGDWLSDDLDRFPAEFVLFAGHVSSLSLENRPSGKRREIRCVRDTEIVILDEGGNTSVWKIFSTTYRPTQEARKEAGELADRDELPLHWAVPLEGRVGRGKFWAFFPTQYETTLSGIINAPWKTNEDRQNLLPSQMNQELLEVAARLTVESIPALVKREDPGWILEVLPGRIDESPQWADRILNTRIYQIAKKEACMPDQFGQVRVPGELNCTPGHLPSRAYEEWASVTPRSSNWPHPTSESRSRRARMERLFEPEVKPASISQWLEALVQPGSALHSTAALRVASTIWGDEGPSLHRDEIRHARIVLAETGELVALNPASLFIVNPTLAEKPAVPYVHPEVASDQTVIEFLRRVGIQEADVSGEFTNYCSRGLHKFNTKDWERFWLLAASAGSHAIDVLKARNDLHLVRVRTVSGDFQPIRTVMMPGAIANPGEDTRVAVDIEFHAKTLEILSAIGVSAAPSAPRGSLEESWGITYRAAALEAYDAALTTRQRPMESYLKFFRTQCAGPLEPLFNLSESGKARFTEHILSLNESSWTFGHTSQLSYPVIKFPPPSVWIARNFGYLHTSLGIRPVADAVARALNRWLLFFPVVEPDLDISQLNLPSRLDQLSEEFWKAAFVAAGSVRDEAALGDFYAEASGFHSPPDKLCCRLGARFEAIPPSEITVAIHRSEGEALADGGYPFVFVEQETRANTLISRWKFRPAELSVKTGVVPVPSSSENLLVKEFPPLRGCSPHIQEYVLVPCSSLREETLTPSGKVGERVDWHVEDKRIYFLDSMSDSELLERLNLHFSLDLTDDEKRDILEHRIQEDVQRLLAEIRLTDGAPAKLAKILNGNRDTLLKHLPRGLIEAVSMDGKQTDILRLAQLAHAVYSIDLFREFANDLSTCGIEPPTRWSGSSQALGFVASLGLGKEFAGFESSRRDPLLEVQGPPQLPALHDFQGRILDRIKEMVVRKGPGRGILCLPTGAGKTRVAVQALVESVVSSTLQGPIVWIAQSDELCEQAVQSWSECWRTFGDRRTLSVSRMWGVNQAQGIDSGPQVVVATIEKISNRVEDDLYEWLARCSCIVVDEAHGSINPEYTSVLRWLGLDISQREIKHDRCPLIGLTATPFRGHSEEETRRLVGRYGGYRIDKEVLGEDPYRTLQGMGVLAHVDHRLIAGADIELTEGEQSELRKFVRLPATVEERLGTDGQRNRALLESFRSLDPEMGSDWTAILFATSVDHARVMAALLNLEGIPSAAITAETDVGARRYYVEGFRRGSIRVLTNYGVLAQGFDAPSVRVIFVARPTFSPNLYQQMIGRGLRGPKNGGKERCLIVNVRDNLDRYGVQLAFHHFDHLWRGR